MGASDSFRTARWLRTLNLVLQAILVLTLVGGLNYVARNHTSRIDLTRYHRFSLSPETLSYLHELSRPVKVVVTYDGEFKDPQVKGLLSEYAYATEANPEGAITTEYVDFFQQARKLEQYHIDQPGVVLLVCGDKQRALSLDELYKVENKERKAFIGEQALTAAILDVSSPERKRIYFLVGHSELRPDDVDPTHGLSAIRDELRLRNFDVQTLELGSLHKIPDDASLLISVAPQTPYSAFEQELLRQYLGPNAGRMIVFLAPGFAHGLEDLFLDWGIIVDDDLLLDSGADNVTEDGDLMIRAYSAHPITQTLLNYKTLLRLGLTRTVRPLPARSLGNGLTVVTLAAASKTAWGEMSYRERGPQSYTPGVDLRGLPRMDPPDRLGVAIASERVAVRNNLAFSVPGGRLVVFGTGDMISNSRIAAQGGEAIFLGAVNWTVGRDKQLNAPSRPIERFALSLSAGELTRLRYTLLFALPGLAALLGICVYWTRRH